MLVFRHSICLNLLSQRTKGEYFQLLYAFAQYYLQVYSNKTASFLEYLAYMSTYASELSVQGLLKLDNEFHHMYIQNPT